MTNLADHVLARLGPNGTRWQKHLYGDWRGTGRVCLSGAVMSVASDTLSNVNSKDFQQVRALLREVIFEQFPEHGKTDSTIAEFNDHSNTTWEDIKLVLEKASARYPTSTTFQETNCGHQS